MDFIAKNIAEVAPSMTLSITSQAKALKKQGVDVLNFGAGEPDFDTPAPIIAAAIEALNTGKTRYTESAGILELREAIAAKLLVDNKVQVLQNVEFLALTKDQVVQVEDNAPNP